MSHIEVLGIKGADDNAMVSLSSGDDPEWGMAGMEKYAMLGIVEHSTRREAAIVLDVEGAHVLLHALNDWIGTQVDQHPDH